MVDHSWFLRGTLEQELNFTPRDLMGENCALAAAINLPSASRYVHKQLLLQTHRGEKSCGIISWDGKRSSRRLRMGSIKKQFLDVAFEKELPGDVSLGHNRYATSGDPNNFANIQPFGFTGKYGEFFIAHNGTLVNSDRLRQEFTDNKGTLFQSGSDSELIAHMIAHSTKPTLEEAVFESFNQARAAFSVMLMTEDTIYAARDLMGIRPLSYARVGRKSKPGFMIASENYVFDQFDNIESKVDLLPGEAVIFKRGEQPRHIKYADHGSALCVFEAIYFSLHMSRINDVSHKSFRAACGKKLYETTPALQNLPKDETIIVPIPNSGLAAAQGLHLASRYPIVYAFTKLEQTAAISAEDSGTEHVELDARSFIAASQPLRTEIARQKLHLENYDIRGKRIIMVEDSIVRGTTSEVNVKRLFSSGAKEVYVAVVSPPIQDICPYGIDINNRKELAFVQHGSIDQVRNFIGANGLFYLSVESMNQVVASTYNIGVCAGCFTRKYPIPYNVK